MSAASQSSSPAGRFDVRRMSWRRLAGLLLIAAGAGAASIYFSESMLMLSADGLVLRERLVAAAPYEARVKQVLVRSGDYVHAGETIAVLESATIARSLADLAAQRVQLVGRVAHLEARRIALDALLPIAKTNDARVRALLGELEQIRERGMTNVAHLQQITSDAYVAKERLETLRAEQMSANEELQQNRSALAELDAAYQSLKSVYADGVLVAGASGTVGPAIAAAGEVVVPGHNVLEIYTGRPFVVAYLPDGAINSVEEGERVQVSAAGRRANATVEKILPMAETLPPELQKPAQARESSQLLRIALTDEHDFATRQRVRVTGCHTSDCAALGDAAIAAAITAFTRLSGWFSSGYVMIVHRVEQWVDAIRASQPSTPGWVRKANAAE